MQFSISKTKTVAIIIIVLLMASVTLTIMPVQAQEVAHGGAPTGTGGASVYPLPAGVTPTYTTTSYAYLSARPKTIGVGQSVLINIWITPGVFVGNYFTGYKVTITSPDNTTETITLNSYHGDATAWLEYIVTQVGTYKFKFDFPGGYFPPGVYYTNPGAFFGGGTNTTMAYSRWYTPASTPYTTEVVVQNEIVSSWPASPLPTGYWERPVHFENREWAAILGNYPWDGSGEGYANWPEGTNYFKGNTKYNAWVKASTTSHILWKRLDAISGMIGPEAGTDALTSSGSAPGLIYAGRCYQTRTVPINGVPTSCAVSYNLRTGEQYYAIPTSQGGVTPTSINYVWGGGLGGGTGEVPGGTEQIGTSVELLALSGTTMLKINPVTGAVTNNITGVLSGTKIGEFVISISGGRLINWTTRGTSTNFTSRIQENRSVSFTSIGSNIDWETGLFGSLTTLSYQGAPYGVRIIGYSLKTGQMTCNTTDTLVPYTTSQTIVDHGKIACLMQDGYAAAWDLQTGKRLWKSQQTYEVGGYPWGIWGAYSSASYGGNLILCEYDGVYAFNWNTGKISWVYKDPSVPFETPYEGWNPFNTGVSIADGMVYTYNTEHTQTKPITRGWKLHCINATTGKGVWNITTPMSPGAMADGYTTAGAQDGYMYVFGAGKSATAITASPKTIANGAQVLIEGTVLDQSPAQPGTPCVSKDSMSTQMEYLHIQLPIDGIFHNVQMTGVPVTLTAIDSNGNVENIGTVTTNPYYGTFSEAWTPPIEGTYTIMASFAGDASYSSSGAATAITVGPAPTTAPTPVPPEPATDYTGLLYTIIAAVVVAIVIGLIAVFLALRKR